MRLKAILIKGLYNTDGLFLTFRIKISKRVSLRVCAVVHIYIKDTPAKFFHESNSFKRYMIEEKTIFLYLGARNKVSNSTT